MIFLQTGEYCEELTLLDYDSNSRYNFDVEASSSEVSALNAMEGSGSSWTPTMPDVTSDGEVWLKFVLNADAQTVEPSISDIWLNIADASEVRLLYTFRELPSPTDIEIPPSQVVTNPLHIDVRSVGIQTGYNVTAVKIIIVPATALVQPSVSGMEVRVCANPYECKYLIRYQVNTSQHQNVPSDLPKHPIFCESKRPKCIFTIFHQTRDSKYFL